MLNFKKDICSLLSPLTEMSPEEIEALLEIPPDADLGEYAFPCYQLAKYFKKDPRKIAEDLSSQVTPTETIARAENAGPYLNFYIRRTYLAARLLPSILAEGEDYGSSSEGEGSTIVIDYSAPNIAKPFGVGHLRSTVIGNALYRIYSYLGYDVVGVNYLGDWGTQFGKLIAAYLRWGEEEKLKDDPVGYLYNLYVTFHREAEEDPQLEDEARGWFRKLELGHRDAVNLWEKFRALSLEEFKRLYGHLGVKFDSYHGESFFNEKIDEVIDIMQAKGLVKESEGALLADLESYGLPSCLLRKRDGGTLYIARDIAAAIYRHENYNFSQMLYVVGSEQTLHFQQLFKILELMGFEWAGKCYHVPFGLIHFKDGRMSTREGKVIFLEDVLKRAVELAYNIIEEKNPDLHSKEEAARMVGYGAIIFGDLVNDRIKDIEFDWDKVLDFSGETAPYIQYSQARICSILRKAQTTGNYSFKEGNSFPREPSYPEEFLRASEEERLIITLARFEENIKRSAQDYRPSYLARYLLELARDFNKFYHNCPVLSAGEELKKARLMLIEAVRIILNSGLNLLGIEAPQEM